MHHTHNIARPRAGFGKPDPRTGTVLVELRTANGVALVEYSCSSRVVPLNSSSFCSTRRAPALPAHALVASGVHQPYIMKCTTILGVLGSALDRVPLAACRVRCSSEAAAPCGAPRRAAQFVHVGNLRGSLELCRVARMVRHPVLGALAQMMWSFNSLSALYVTHFPQLQVLRTGAVLPACCGMPPLQRVLLCDEIELGVHSLRH